ncbi:MAG: FAD binding domain-containing protein, partial [Deltaproteobacteria bacterium]
MKSFKHFNAKTVDDAILKLTEYKQSKVIAGGTDYLSVLKNGVLLTYPEALVNIKTIPGLDSIEEDGDRLKIGALTKLSDIADSPIVKEKYSILGDAAKSVGSPQIRSMGTIGGNLGQDVRCWYYRYPHQIGGRILCLRKGGKICNALTGDHRYHSIFGAASVAVYPCSSNCPANINIPSYLSRVRNGDLMEAARILSLRGHTVVLFEKEARLGGQLNLAAVHPHKKRIRPLISYFETQLKEQNVEIRLNVEADLKHIRSLRPDAVILATGALPV